MLLKLVDYAHQIHDFEIGKLENISSIFIEVITGDEIATVYYKDGTSKRFDSSYFNIRMISYHDCSYYAYDNEDVNLLENEKWLISNDSYERSDISDDTDWGGI